MKRFDSVDAFIDGAEYWQDELRKLRKILLSTELAETVKWGGPCYTHEGKNVVGMGAFKSYFGLWFFQGALLSDSAGVLINAQAGKTKALRQWRFKSNKDISAPLIKKYIGEAIKLQTEGKEIKPTKGQAVKVPPQLQAALKKNAQANAAFQKLTPGKRREYADYIAEAKRDETKEKRIEKIIPMIAAGQGLHDKYRK